MARPARKNKDYRQEKSSSRSHEGERRDGKKFLSGGGKNFAAENSPKNFSAKRPAVKKNFGEKFDDLCWGRNPVLTLLRNRPELCRKIFLLQGGEDSFRDRVAQLCADEKIPLEFVERAELDALTGGAVHQGVAAKMLPIPPADLDDVTDAIEPNSPSLVVLMDHCQDPHNLGAVIRTAEVAGASCVVCQNDRSATVNGTVVKTSAGAAFRLPVVQVVNVSRALERLKSKGFWVVGLDHRARETVWDSPLPDRLVLVVGSEGDGIASLTAKNCDKLVKFPMAGRTGNLNASVAAALGMFEWMRLHGAAKT